MMTSEAVRKYNMRMDALKSERATWDSHWKEIAEYVTPRRARFFLDDTNKGTKKNNKIINSTATKALRVLAAGMHAGITSPARPWMRMAVANVPPEINERQDVKIWVSTVMQRMYTVMARSNFYNSLALVYTDLGAFGTAVMWVDEDPEDLIRCYVLPIGEYYLTTDHRNMVNGLYREFRYTVAQVVDRWGIDVVSTRVKSAYEAGRLDEPVDIIHVLEPRSVRDIDKQDSYNMPFRSCWYEKDRTDGTVLKESGYRRLPFMAARWGVTGTDVYGSGNPAMDCLGDIKALQELERRDGQIVDKITNPPMKGPSSLRNQRASLLPGDITYVDSPSGGATFEPAMQMPPQAVQVVTEKIGTHERRIDGSFMTDIWLMMASSDRREITAREVDERHEEKMLQLGPTLERLHDELLDPLIERIFDIMLHAGQIPPPPPDLEGQDLDVEYVSILAQAQKLLSTSGVERLATFTGNLANVEAEVKDRINWDQMVKHYADILGVDPSLIEADDIVNMKRQQRAQQMAEMQRQQQMQEQAKTVQSLARADTSGQNALTDLMGAAGGEMAEVMGG